MTTSRSAAATCRTDSGSRQAVDRVHGRDHALEPEVVLDDRLARAACRGSAPGRRGPSSRRPRAGTRGISPRSRRPSRSRSSSARSPRREQQTQPLFSSTVRSSTRRSRWWSIATSPSSLTITAVSPIPGCASRRESSVVFPLPRKPVRSATGRPLSARARTSPGSQRVERRAGQPLRLHPERAEVRDDRRSAPCGRGARTRGRSSRRAAGRSGRARGSAARPGACARAGRPPARPSAPPLAPRRARTWLSVVPPDREESDGKGDLLLIGVDVDAVAGWLGSYGGEDSPDDISRGIFAGEVGTLRLLKMFDKYGLKTTWFIPGHSIETFPEETKMIVDAGHEIGMHGYSHENPIAMTPEQEEAVLRQVHRPDRGRLRPPADRLRRAVVGVLERHQRAAARARDQVRPQPDAQRLPSRTTSASATRGRRSTTRSSPRSG